MSTTKKLFTGGMSRVALSLTQMAIGFFMMPFLVSHLGDRWYGVWTVLSGIIGYFYLADMGLSRAVQIYVARHVAVGDVQSTNRVINTSLVVYGAIASCIILATLGLSYFAGFFVPAEHDSTTVQWVLLILGINLALEFPFSAFSGIISAYLRYELHSGTRLIVLIINTCLTAYFISHGYGILALALISLTCGQIANGLFFLISKFCFKELRVSPKLFDWSKVRELASYSLWSFMSNISALMKAQLDAIIVAFVLGPIAVTHYSIGQRLSEYFKSLLFQSTSLAMPVLARYHVLNQSDEMRKKLFFLTKINSILASFGGGSLIALGAAFIQIWMGDRYLDAYPILIILVVAMAIDMSMDPIKTAMAASNWVRLTGLLDLMEACANVAISIVLALKYGLIGVALGTLIPVIIFKLITLPVMSVKSLNISLPGFYWSALAPVLLTALALGLTQWIIATNYILDNYLKLIVAGLAPIPIFALLSYFILLKSEDRRLIKNILPG